MLAALPRRTTAKVPSDERARCSWCGEAFKSRARGGTAQRFCSARCRVSFHTAARRWAEQAIADGTLTVAELRRAP
jgi:hypothetical protein